MKSFKLELDGGNEAMDTPQDVADALERIAAQVREMDEQYGFSSPIRDANGNTVGEYVYRLGGPEVCPDCGHRTVTTHRDGSQSCGRCYVNAYNAYR